jgi:hypothetical protein
MSSTDEETCPLCGRELGQENVDLHHLIPKTFKGKVTVPIHKICHRKIHATFTERELNNYYHTFERILENEHIRNFVTWVRRKPAGFYDGSKETSERKSKRRR